VRAELLAATGQLAVLGREQPVAAVLKLEAGSREASQREERGLQRVAGGETVSLKGLARYMRRRCGCEQTQAFLR